jgi:ADP-ribose pyrophosphatase
MEKKIRTLASLLAPSFSAHLDEVALMNGEISKRIRIDHPEASAIVPFLSGDKILMVRQYRYALGMETLEIPAGKVDPGENPETCARRELLEETGYHAPKLVLLYTYAPAIGYSNERIHIYSAEDLEWKSNKTDEREISSVEEVGLTDLHEMVRQGRMVDGKTLIGLAVAGIMGSALDI